MAIYKDGVRYVVYYNGNRYVDSLTKPKCPQAVITGQTLELGKTTVIWHGSQLSCAYADYVLCSNYVGYNVNIWNATCPWGVTNFTISAVLNGNPVDVSVTNTCAKKSLRIYGYNRESGTSTFCLGEVIRQSNSYLGFILTKDGFYQSDPANFSLKDNLYGLFSSCDGVDINNVSYYDSTALGGGASVQYNMNIYYDETFNTSEINPLITVSDENGTICGTKSSIVVGGGSRSPISFSTTGLLYSKPSNPFSVGDKIYVTLPYTWGYYGVRLIYSVNSDKSANTTYKLVGSSGTIF